MECLGPWPASPGRQPTTGYNPIVPSPDRRGADRNAMNPLPPLHTTVADFAVIRKNKAFYVDKTGLLRDLLAAHGRSVDGSPPMLDVSHQFLARPRRFGKSLLVSTLEAWFQGLPPGHVANPAGSAASPEVPGPAGMPAGWTSPVWLWAGLDAADWHGHHGWHPVVRLDMSNVVTLDPALQGKALRHYMEDLVELWTDRGAPWQVEWSPAMFTASPDRILRTFIRRLGQAYRKQPVVLIDEYDAPVTEHIGTDRNPKPVVDELRLFYRTLKDDEHRLYGVFITGITRFPKQHLFSALNNVADISDLPAYGAICGFTETEVSRAFGPYREALADLEPGLRDHDIQADWRVLYNGYRFSRLPDADRVYNPFTLTRGLDLVLSSPGLRREAAAGQWPSAWSESGHPGLAARLARDTGRELPAPGRTGAAGPAPDRGLRDLTHPDYNTLMLDTGYYTWHGGRDGVEPHLNFPNGEVAESWIRDILNLGQPEHRHKLHPVLDNLRACLERGDVSGFAGHVEAFAFGLARENLQGEATFRILLQSLLKSAGFPVIAEKSTVAGRPDLEVHLAHRVHVIEVKFNRPVAEARNQIRNRMYGREHLGRDRHVTAVGLAFRYDGRTAARLEYSEDNLADLLADPDADRPPPGI